MTKKSFSPPTVPWYAHRGTAPLRPKEPRPLPEEVIRDKITRGRIYQALYQWVRANWSEGDWFYMLPTAPSGGNYHLADRFGVFKALRPQGALSRVFVQWADDGHKINPEVITFYRHAVKLDADGEMILLPRIHLPEEPRR